MCAGTSCFTKAVFGPVQRFGGGVRGGPIGLILVSCWIGNFHVFCLLDQTKKINDITMAIQTNYFDADLILLILIYRYLSMIQNTFYYYQITSLLIKNNNFVDAMIAHN